MRRKPKGTTYRNLSARSGAIYYERVWKGRRFCFSTKTTDWDQAAAVRDLYEERKGIGQSLRILVDVPTFEEFARRYLAEDTHHLAPTSRYERELALKADGPIISFFGSYRLDDLTSALVREWWTLEVQGRGRSTKTGRNYLDALSGVLGYGAELGLLDANPVDAFRAILRRKTRTQRGRAESDPARNIRPIEDTAEISRLVDAAHEEGTEAHLLVLLLLDAGLRLGEALGLRWRAVVWGQDDDDPRRAIVIDESRPRGGAPGPTKSGRARRVALSRRLRLVLLEVYRSGWGPRPEERVLGYGDPSVFRRVQWRRILKRADIGRPKLKDLRDTFASHLLSAGIQLGYVSTQLGHADVGVTARHYAKWVGADTYREPMQLLPGEVPADLLARLPESQRSPKTLVRDDETIPVSARDPWWSQRDLNPCLQGVNLRVVQQLLGHESITTTELYLHDSETEKRAAAHLV